MSHSATAVRRTRIIAALAAVGLITGLGALAAPTHAEEPETPDSAAKMVAAKASQSVTATATLKSNKRKKLRVSLIATKNGSLTVSVGGKGGEEHAWSFKVPKKTLKLNGKGKGKLVTKKIKPYGTIKLKIKPVKKWKTKKCKGKVISKSRALKVNGLFKFNTKSAWGKVGGKKVAFKGAKFVKSTGNSASACSGGNDGGEGGDGDKCPAPSASWSAFVGNRFLSSQWKPGAKTTTVMASRTTQLAKPKGAMRADFRMASVPTPTLTRSGTGVTVAVKSKGALVGSATLSSPTGYPLTRTCEHTLTSEETFWAGVSYQNGSKPLAMKMTAYGNISLPNNNAAVVQVRSKAS